MKQTEAAMDGNEHTTTSEACGEEDELSYDDLKIYMRQILVMMQQQHQSLETYFKKQEEKFDRETEEEYRRWEELRRLRERSLKSRSSPVWRSPFPPTEKSNIRRVDFDGVASDKQKRALEIDIGDTLQEKYSASLDLNRARYGYAYVNEDDEDAFGDDSDSRKGSMGLRDSNTQARRSIDLEVSQQRLVEVQVKDFNLDDLKKRRYAERDLTSEDEASSSSDPDTLPSQVRGRNSYNNQEGQTDQEN